ncbi:hypothetical protein ACOZ32_05010 [Halobacterium sp. MBLA0001]|uniref:hypothetical protein n=1 Tax=Halobacterium sp. MBLA0001 TaxID=3413511 RepID=UPI003C729AA0
MDVTILTTSEVPERAIQTAYNATKRESTHVIVAPDEVTATRVNRWLEAPVAGRTANGIRPFSRTDVLKHDGVVAVTAAGTTSPTWCIRGTDAEADRSRVCELRHDERVIATYDLREGTVTLNDSAWIDVEQQVVEEARPAVAPATDSQTSPDPTTWRPINPPLVVPLAAPLTESTVYALPDASGDGLSPVNEAPRAINLDDQSSYEQTVTVVNEVLAQRTVESPTAAIDYDEFTEVVSRQLQARDCSQPKTVINEVLETDEDVRVGRAGDGLRQLFDRAWAVPLSMSGD